MAYVISDGPAIAARERLCQHLPVALGVNSDVFPGRPLHTESIEHKVDTNDAICLRVLNALNEREKPQYHRLVFDRVSATDQWLIDEMRNLLNLEIKEGGSYPQENEHSDEDFRRYFMSHDCFALCAVKQEEKFSASDAERSYGTADSCVQCELSIDDEVDEDWNDWGAASGIVGTCEEMCPLAEAEQRHARGDVSQFELNVSKRDNKSDRCFSPLLVKQFSRPSVNLSQPDVVDPRTIRTPAALARTMHFLLGTAAANGGAASQAASSPLSSIVSRFSDARFDSFALFRFLSDRLRAVGTDITVQRLCGPAAVRALEQSARFRLVSFYFLLLRGTEDPARDLLRENHELLKNCLVSLQQLYLQAELLNQRQRVLVRSCSEEFYSLYLQLNVYSSEFGEYLQQLPARLYLVPGVRLAITAHAAVRDMRFSYFFRLLEHNATPFLSSLALFAGAASKVRSEALRTLNSQIFKHGGFHISELSRMLGFGDVDATESFLGSMGLLGACVDNSVSAVPPGKTFMPNQCQACEPVVPLLHLPRFLEKKFADVSFTALIVSAHDNNKPTKSTGKALFESAERVLVGCFYIKPNYPGRCAHICNGGFIVARRFRKLGAARMLARCFVFIGRDLGYIGSIFNLVFVTNVASMLLWRSMGFREIGKVPSAGRLKNHPGLVDAVMFHFDFRSLGPTTWDAAL